MKKIIFYVFALMSGISLNGCYDLDTYPGDTLSSSLFWKTEEHAKQGLMAIYAGMRNNDAFGMNFMFDALGDIASNYDQWQYFPRGTHTDREGAISRKWQNLYDGVQVANGFIRNVSGMSGLDDDVKDAYIAEAKFMRALYYFSLLDVFGGVPYYDETTDINIDFANLKKPRSTEDELRSYILADLGEAISKLRVSWDEANYGRATKGAAYALRGKVYMYNKDWKNAIADFEEVVYNRSNNYGYELDADFARIFKLHSGAKSREMIFSVQNKGDIGALYGMPMAVYMGNNGSYGRGWSNSMPLSGLVDMYECPDGKPFDWEDVFPGYNSTPVENGARTAKRQEIMSVELSGGVVVGLRNADTAKILNAYKNRDPRLMATIIVPYSHFNGWASNQPKDILFAIDGNNLGNPEQGTIRHERGYVSYFWKKFVPESNLDGAINSYFHTPFEFPLIRYADVLLMLAESYNEDNQLDKAVAEFNKVRTRASVHMPGLNSGATWLAVTTKEQMAERIRKERALEFAGEGHRFSDLRRWGWEIASQALSDVDAVNLYGEFFYTHKFNQRDMLWPIPGAEIEKNPALTKNPGW